MAHVAGLKGAEVEEGPQDQAHQEGRREGEEGGERSPGLSRVLSHDDNGVLAVLALLAVP